MSFIDLIRVAEQADVRARELNDFRVLGSVLAHRSGMHDRQTGSIHLKYDGDADPPQDTQPVLDLLVGDGMIIAQAEDATLVSRDRMFIAIEHAYDLDIFFYGSDIDEMTALYNLAHEKFHYVEPKRKHTDEITPVKIWRMTPMGPDAFTKMLPFQPWDEIAGNYATEASDKLGHIMKGGKPERESGMLVWTGPPGTGKTTAIRTLAREWGRWATMHIISDTEVFLNDPSYLMSVAMGGGSRPNLIVLEDAGEMLIRDARQQSGQALSRLLNFTDGILGQGANVYFLLTTNEDFSELHGAVTRPGRALPNGVIHFGNLDTEAANAWLDEREIPEHVTIPTSLAKLYGLKAEHDATKEPEPTDMDDEEPDATGDVAKEVRMDVRRATVALRG